MQGLFVETSEVSEVDDDESDVLEHISFSFIDLTEMTGIKTFILDSCNGLILFGHRQEPSDPLYYTVCDPTTKQCHSDLQHILVVDGKGKARRMIPVPGMADGRPGHAFVCYLGQSQGHLHCVTKKNEKLSTGVLQDYDTHEWVLKNTVNSLDVFGETGRFLEFQVVDIHQDCNVVFFLHDYCKLTAYDMDCKEASVIATFKNDKDQCDFARYVPYFLESPDLTNKH
ncbi:unnamed protein product [Miscanthus lutarioriparius]|uniref:Uncharacterized protein n=1 Tax=Miscanthus lutarioriparius TaxID=422564 RepID=A0A811S9H8_9POAL|nr:unnamed protein product [Miscanthus lutarioriparius]